MKHWSCPKKKITVPGRVRCDVRSRDCGDLARRKMRQEEQEGNLKRSKGRWWQLQSHKNETKGFPKMGFMCDLYGIYVGFMLDLYGIYVGFMWDLYGMGLWRFNDD